MSDLKICRICLCKGVKMYNYNQFNLKLYYEQVMAKEVYEKDGLPHNFCYVCAAMLYKFYKFKEKCYSGEKAFKELLWRGPITLSKVSKINRQERNLQIPIDIITVSKRVKTVVIRNKSLNNSLTYNVKTITTPEKEICKIDNDSDNSTDNENLSEIENEINYEVDLFEIEKTETTVQQIDTDKNQLPNIEEDCKTFSDHDDLNKDNINEQDKTVVEDELSNQVVNENELLSNNTRNTVQDVNKANEKNHGKIVRKRPKKNKNVTENEKASLDPNHWLKINLSEEEALKEFEARAQDKRYLSAAYQCTDCLKAFSKEDMLNRHIKLRHSELVGPVVCRFCKVRFKWKCYLTLHITQHYTKYKCLRCDTVCPLKTTAVFHNEYHNGVMRKCKYCGEEFRHSSTYYTHLRTMHRSEHVCTLCGASFVSTTGLSIHKKTMHVDTVINPEENVNTYCERCDVTFETRKAYEEHVFHSAKHAEGIENLALETAAPSIPKGEKKCIIRKPRKRTPCTICNKIFPNRAAYNKHHMAEHKEEPLEKPSKEVKRHICDICGTVLAGSSIANHRNTHTKEKIYTCSTCQMQFNSKSSMNRHQLTHTSEKPVACTLCDKRFKQKTSMQLHYRTFHLKEPYPKRNRKKKTDEMPRDEDNMVLAYFYGRK